MGIPAPVSRRTGRLVSRPLGVIPIRSDHGDVHQLVVARSDGKSLTIEDYRRVLYLVAGHDLTESEISSLRHYFAEEDC